MVETSRILRWRRSTTSVEISFRTYSPRLELKDFWHHSLPCTSMFSVQMVTERLPQNKVEPMQQVGKNILFGRIFLTFGEKVILMEIIPSSYYCGPKFYWRRLYAFINRPQQDLVGYFCQTWQILSLLKNELSLYFFFIFLWFTIQ